ncbi:centromere protein U [Manis pentadactyla]|uniref:centromere protein U n=1 Tax=Manis pentadactyla TaxID=143292 RepID=UPI00255D0719|nr:centromere protein U [Manis pentadactyla]KAI5211230.1 Centromere Protein U [Manis pentadactyla]
MAPPRRTRRAGVRSSKDTVGRARSTEDKVGEKPAPTNVFDFPDDSPISSISRLVDNEKDEEPYETFDPPLHSTAIYADEEEFSRLCGSSTPSPPQGKEARISSDTSEIEASENESLEISAKKPGRKPQPISDDSESAEDGGGGSEVDPAEAAGARRRAAGRAQRSGTPAGPVAPRKAGARRAAPSVKNGTLATEGRLKTQRKVFHDKGKKSRSKAIDSGFPDCVHIWCLKEKKTSDIMELDVVLSAFEETLLGYKQKIESKICKEAINKFHCNMKEELIKILKEVQTLKTLKRKNAKMISDIDKKRQHLIEVQGELLRLEPQLKQLQTKHDELKERRSLLRNAAYFLSNLKQLHQDYSDIQEKEPNVKETYDSSSLPAMLFKARTLLGAESHLQNINHQLEKLLE